MVLKRTESFVLCETVHFYFVIVSIPAVSGVSAGVTMVVSTLCGSFCFATLAVVPASHDLDIGGFLCLACSPLRPAVSGSDSRLLL